MSSSPRFTDQEASFFMVATGVRPPEFDTDLASTAGLELLKAAGMIDRELTPLVQERIDAAHLGMSGEMSKAFVTTLEQYTTAPPYILPTVSGLARELGAYTITTADQVEAMKIQAIAALAVLIAAFMVDAVIAYFDPPEGIKAAIAQWLAVRAALEALLGSLLLRFLEMVVIGIAIQETMDTVAQIVMRAKGIEQTWNWRETLDQIGIGALGGAMGVVLMPLEEKLTGVLANLLHHLPGAGIKILGRDLGEVLGEDLGKSLGKDLREGLGNDMHSAEGGPGAFGRGPSGNPDSELAGGHGRGAGPSWAPTRPSAGTAAFWLHNLAEIPVGIVIGGIHNAGHETLWVLMTTGQATWSWETFAGGSAQAMLHPIAVMTGGGARMLVGVTAPAENLIAAAFGAVTPQHLADIAAARSPVDLPGGIGDRGNQGGGVGRVPDESGDGEKRPPFVPPEPTGDGSVGGGAGPVSEPAVVQLLRGFGAPVGPEAAYGIAVRTGMVPVRGPVSAHPLYDRPFRVTLPALISPADAASGFLDTIANNPGRPLAELHVGGGELPGRADPLPGTAGGSAEDAGAGMPSPGPGHPGGPGHPTGGEGADAGRNAIGNGTPERARHADQPQHPGVHPGGPAAGPEVKVPPAVAAAGTGWIHGGDGWHVAERSGTLDHGPGVGGPSTVEVLAGSRAVLDGSGQLRHVVLPDGVSYERGLDGAWSPPREHPGEVIVVKTGEPVTLTSGGKADAVTLPPESERVLDKGTVVAYRQVRADGGTRLAEPRVFLPDGRGGWEQASSGADPASYEGWLASANKAHDAARTLFDIAARSGPGVPAHERLVNLSDGALRGLLHGSREDVKAAVYEAARRSGVALRWTQMA